MQDKSQICNALNASCHDVAEWILKQEDHRFSFAPSGKWDVSEHLDHLMRTTNAITKGISIPRLLLRFRFGRPNRKSRSYQEVVQRYKEKLSAVAPGAIGPLGVAKHAPATKKTRIEKFRKDNSLLIKKIKKWSESDLDNYLLPHPLLGKMTIRELLMWCSYHHLHHLNILKAKY